MLLIYPPCAKPGEPPAGIAFLAGALRQHGLPCTLLDANLEGIFSLLSKTHTFSDTWSIRASRNLDANLAALRDPAVYANVDKYRRAVADVNRVLEQVGRSEGIGLSLANYQDRSLSPLNSHDLLKSAKFPEKNIFYDYFAERLSEVIGEDKPAMVGFSLNYLSQALCTFAMIGYIRKSYPAIKIVLGGGLVTSWLRSSAWQDPFADLIDHMIAGPGERPLLALLGQQEMADHYPPQFDDLPLADYLSPGLIMPYAASSGCYWNNCAFCPEKAEDNPYTSVAAEQVLDDLALLTKKHNTRLLHLLDNAVSPRLMKSLANKPPGVDWYGFARVSPLLADVDFCQQLRDSGCVMLKLGIESGDQGVLDAMHKGIDLDLVSRCLRALQAAGIATYVYLLFGTPSETIVEARRTLEFVVRHKDAITFLNLAVFNMPVGGAEARQLAVNDFYEADLSLYTDFIHPRGWERKAIRQFLDQEFKRQPDIAAILRRNPPIFTSNHASFFVI